MSLDHAALTDFRYASHPEEARPFPSVLWRSPGAESLRQRLGVGPGQVTGLLFRQVATPNYEMRHFLNICRRKGWRPVVLTYHADKMSCHNPAKRALVRLQVITGVNKKAEPIWSRHALGSHEELEGWPLNRIRLDGRSLVGLHESSLQAALPHPPRTIDASSWFKGYLDGARGYYFDLMESLGDGLVLVEDFLTEDKAESRFFSEIVQPAYAHAAQRAGHPPPIQAMTHGRRVNSPFWYAYPATCLPHFRACGAKI